MYMNFKKKAFLVIALFYICYVLFPLFGDLLKISPVLASIVTLSACVVLYPRALANRTMIWCSLYIFILYIYLILGRPITVGIGDMSDTRKFIIECAFLLPPLAIYSILLHLNDIKINKVIAVSSIAMIVITAVYLFPLLMESRTLLRVDDARENIALQIPGIPLYTLMHGYAILLPIFLYNYRVSSQRIIAIVLLIVICYLIYSSYVTTSLILSLISFLFAIIYHAKNKFKVFTILFLMTLTVWLLIHTGVVEKLLDWLVAFYDGTFVAEKISDVKDSLVGKTLTGRSIVGRIEHHNVSLESFMINPIFGTGVIGAHSFIIDRLGGMGLVVFIPFVAMFISILKKNYCRLISRDAKAYYWLVIFLITVMLYNKGLFGKEGWLIMSVIIPSCLITFERRNNKQ